MNVIKKIAIAVATILVLLVVIGFFLPSKVHVERSVNIAAPPEQIYVYAGTPKRWPEWVAWKPTKWEFPGAETGVGAESKWDDSTGGGHLKMTKADPQKGVEYDLAFAGAPPVPGWIRFSPEGATTKVVWAFDAESSMNPLNRYFCYFALDSLVGADFEKGLANLKKKVEAESLPAEAQPEKPAAENPPPTNLPESETPPAKSE
ncbi:SRPBCC family protein [Anatilimnocola floriformis]|uniref:SRPBCC family protein n=1 Tax=Anatilimnocola floriformis TaxID=2948575 RepID=UPI0020C534BB|nr:SRPBCC family protein [Anatilimnocola floriformis]